MKNLTKVWKKDMGSSQGDWSRDSKSLLFEILQNFTNFQTLNEILKKLILYNFNNSK